MNKITLYLITLFNIKTETGEQLLHFLVTTTILVTILLVIFAIYRCKDRDFYKRSIKKGEILNFKISPSFFTISITLKYISIAILLAVLPLTDRIFITKFETETIFLSVSVLLFIISEIIYKINIPNMEYRRDIINYILIYGVIFISLIVVISTSGSGDLVNIVESQKNGVVNWNIFKNPLSALTGYLLFIAILDFNIFEKFKNYSNYRGRYLYFNIVGSLIFKNILIYCFVLIYLGGYHLPYISNLTSNIYILTILKLFTLIIKTSIVVLFINLLQKSYSLENSRVINRRYLLYYIPLSLISFAFLPIYKTVLFKYSELNNYIPIITIIIYFLIAIMIFKKPKSIIRGV